MRCVVLTYLHVNATTFRSIVNCTWCFLCSLLPVRTSLTRHILCLSLHFSFESQIAFMKYLNPNSLFMKVVPFIRKWLIVDFDNIGGSVKVRCFYSFNLTATKYPLRQYNRIMPGVVLLGWFLDDRLMKAPFY